MRGRIPEVGELISPTSLAATRRGTLSLMDPILSGVGTTAILVAVASNLRLVTESVAAMLERCGFQVARVCWPGREQGTGMVREIAEVRPDVAVLVCEVGEDGDTAAVDAVRSVIGGWEGPSLVMTGLGPEPVWGGMLEVGAEAVIASTTRLEDLLEAIDALAKGEAITGIVERQILVRQWLAVQAERAALQARLDHLTPREREVLDLLYLGAAATAIAADLGVSEATVRSQIRAILHKLGVSSQLAAVAILRSTKVVARDG